MSQYNNKFQFQSEDKLTELENLIGLPLLMALEIWENSCERNSPEEFTCNEDYWNTFVIKADKIHSPLTSQMLKESLKQVFFWGDEYNEIIDYYCKLYEASRSLLRQYTLDQNDEFMSFIDSALAIAEPINEARGVKVTIKNVRAELSKCFFHPEDEDDLTQISNNLHPWLIQAYKELNGGSINKAIEIATGILDEIGRRFETDEYYCCFDDYCPTDEDCLNAAYIITQIMQTANTKQSSQQKVMTALKAISKHRSFNDYGYFDIDTFVKNYGMYPFKSGWQSMFKYYIERGEL